MEIYGVECAERNWVSVFCVVPNAGIPGTNPQRHLYSRDCHVIFAVGWIILKIFDRIEAIWRLVAGKTAVAVSDNCGGNILGFRAHTHGFIVRERTISRWADSLYIRKAGWYLLNRRIDCRIHGSCDRIIRLRSLEMIFVGSICSHKISGQGLFDSSSSEIQG